VELFRKALFPDFEAGAFLGSRGKFGAVASLSFGVQWPLFSREKQKPQLAAAELRYKAALAEVEAEKLALAENLASLEARMSQASAQSTRYEQAILPLAAAALEAARASFLAGRGDFATVVEDFNLWLEAKVALASWQAEQFAAALDFACCLGILPWLSGQEVSHEE
jgi:outer membrane protein TolC